jgi:hypothetical protein
MDIDVFSPRELPLVFRVLRTALEPVAPLREPERRFLDTYARIVGHAHDGHDPLPIAAQEVLLQGAHARKRLVQLAAMAVLLATPPKDGSTRFLKALAARLDVREPVLRVIDALRDGHHRLVRVLAMRRAFKHLLREVRLAEGPMGIVRLLGAMFLKARVNTDRTWEFRRLGLLPEGTLGRAYWTHMTATGFAFPGEDGGITQTMAYHDVGHVLAGHAASGLGEIQQGCFQGGNRREDGFFFIQFVLLHFHHGVRITPGAPAEHGHFDAEKVLWAIHRGAQCHVDITHQWNFWPLMPLGLEEARARCGLLPPLEIAWPR